MEKEEYKKLMSEYDFTKHSVKSFCRIYPCSESFVFKCLKEWNIPRTTKTRQVLTPRNNLGRFTLNPLPNQFKTSNTSPSTTNLNSNSKKSKNKMSTPNVKEKLNNPLKLWS
jgi:hypothetical protein